MAAKCSQNITVVVELGLAEITILALVDSPTRTREGGCGNGARPKALNVHQVVCRVENPEGNPKLSELLCPDSRVKKLEKSRASSPVVRGLTVDKPAVTLSDLCCGFLALATVFVRVGR